MILVIGTDIMPMRKGFQPIKIQKEVFFMWGILVAAISGALMSVQGVFNTEVTKQTSIWLSASFVQLTALAVCVAAWFITG